MEENIGTKSIQILNNFSQRTSSLHRTSPNIHTPTKKNTGGASADAKSFWSCREKDEANKGRQERKKKQIIKQPEQNPLNLKS